jgi:hypothetical protein
LAVDRVEAVAMKQVWRRRLAYGSNATVVTVVGMGIMVLLYVAAVQTRAHRDFSAEGRNILSPDMVVKIRLLDADEEPVQITAFTAQQGTADAAFKDRTLGDLMAELGTHGRVIDWRLIDFDRERLTAERLGVTEYGHVVIQRGQDRVDVRARELFRSVGTRDKRRTQFLGEAAIARAFSQLHTPRRRVVYVLSGHGELAVGDRGPSGLSDFADALDVERYDIEALDLLSTGRDGEVPTVPDDAAVVLIPGPRATLTSHEDDAIVSFVGRGGGLMITLDPASIAPDVVGRLGIGLAGGVASDRRVVFPFWDRPIPVIRSHPTTTSLSASGLVPILSHVAPLIMAPTPPTGIQLKPLLTTSRDGWIERGGTLRNGAPVYDDGIDGVGPVNLAVAAQIRSSSDLVRAGSGTARVIVVGDSEFLSNGLFTDGPGNATLSLEAIHWLAGADARVSSVGARRHKVRRLAISTVELGTIRWLSLFLLPAIMGLLGFCVRWSRRGR